MEEKVGECLIRHLEIRKTLAKRKLTQAGLLGATTVPLPLTYKKGGGGGGGGEEGRELMDI